MGITGLWNKAIPSVPWFPLQDGSCQPQTAHRGPCGWQAARQQEAAFGCFNALAVAAAAASQVSRRVQAWKRISSLLPCWCFGWVRSVILNLMSWCSRVVLLQCLARLTSTVWGCGFLAEERKLGYVRPHLIHFHLLELFCPWDWTTASPKSSNCAGPQHQLFCYSVYQCRNSLQVWFSHLTWSYLYVQVSKVSNPFSLRIHLNTDLGISLCLSGCVWV